MPLVSKSEAARLVGVTRQTIHRKIKTGELSATGSEVDTSELIRVFGAISDGTQPVTPMSQPDSAVQTTLQARVDGLESQLAVTREQLADTSKDRDEWREVAKEATSNVKLITNQGSAAKSNDNMMIFIAVAFVVGIGVAHMMLRNDATPNDAMPLPEPEETQSAKQKYYYSRDDQIRIDEGLEPLGPFVSGSKFGGIPLGEDDDGYLMPLKEVSPSDAMQGADVTGRVTPELQADNGSN